MLMTTDTAEAFAARIAKMDDATLSHLLTFADERTCAAFPIIAERRPLLIAEMASRCVIEYLELIPVTEA